jgi:hypothetical protein
VDFVFLGSKGQGGVGQLGCYQFFEGFFGFRLVMCSVGLVGGTVLSTYLGLQVPQNGSNTQEEKDENFTKSG